jgi:hypothetical protein
MSIVTVDEAREQAYQRVIKDLRQCIKAIDARALLSPSAQEMAHFSTALIRSVITAYE